MREKIILSLDENDLTKAKNYLTLFSSHLSWVKLGMEVFYSHGADFVHYAHELGYKIFLDLKLHDIPHTVYKSTLALTKLPIEMLTIHCQGGLEMLSAARQATMDSPHRKIKLLGVTQLTSTDQKMSNELGNCLSLSESVLRLATLASNSKLDGIIASAGDLSFLRTQFPSPFLIITPGIRLKNSNSSSIYNDDQKRVATPQMALKDGSDFSYW